MCRTTQLKKDWILISFPVSAKRQGNSKIRFVQEISGHAGSWWHQCHLDRARAVHTPNHMGTRALTPSHLHSTSRLILGLNPSSTGPQDARTSVGAESFLNSNSDLPQVAGGLSWWFRMRLEITVNDSDSLKEVPEAKLCICLVLCFFLNCYA